MQMFKIEPVVRSWFAQEARFHRTHPDELRTKEARTKSNHGGRLVSGFGQQGFLQGAPVFLTSTS